MHPEFAKAISDTTNTLKSTTSLSPEQAEIIEEARHAYMSLEFIARHNAKNLTNAGKANLRRAQSQIQKLRLKLLDLFTRQRTPSE